MPGKAGTANLNSGTQRNPVIIEAMAPGSLYLGQKRDRIIIGQKVAAIPDQPKITNQKMVRSGVVTATVRAMPRAARAMSKVTIREKPVRFSWIDSGRSIATLQLHADGRVSDITIVTSSGFAGFDAELRRALGAIGDLGPVPARLLDGRASLRVMVPYTFRNPVIE